MVTVTNLYMASAQGDWVAVTIQAAIGFPSFMPTDIM
jgi:hypothetical protein